jgi:hypothetical protein
MKYTEKQIEAVAKWLGWYKHKGAYWEKIEGQIIRSFTERQFEKYYLFSDSSMVAIIQRFIKDGFDYMVIYHDKEFGTYEFHADNKGVCGGGKFLAEAILDCAVRYLEDKNE